MRKNKYLKFESVGANAFDSSAVIKTRKQAWIELHELRKARALMPKEEPRYGTEMGRVQEAFRFAFKNTRIRARARILNTSYLVKVTYERKGLKFSKQGDRAELSTLLDMVKNQVRNHREARREMDVHGGRHIRRTGDYISLVGFVHVEKGFWLGQSEKIKSRVVRESKVPRDLENHIGLELEFCSPLNSDTIGVMLVKAGLGSSVQLKSDGSLRATNPGDRCHELCILAKQGEVHSLVPRVTAVLEEAQAYANETCGFHVHLDMRTRSAEKAWSNLRQVQPILYKMNPESRKKSTYCKPVRSKVFSKARHGRTRYVGINSQALRSHGTLEVRLHSGTVNATEILNWVDLLVTVADSAPIAKTANNLKALVGQVAIPSPLLTYLQSRIKLYAKKRATIAPTSGLSTATVF